MEEAVEVWEETVLHGCWVLMVAGEEHCESLKTGKSIMREKIKTTKIILLK